MNESDITSAQQAVVLHPGSTILSLRAISWVRSNVILIVHIDQQASSSADSEALLPRFLLVGKAGKSIAYSVERQADRFLVVFRITNDGRGRCIPAGDYRLLAVFDTATWVSVRFALDTQPDFTTLNHVFKCTGGETYTVLIGAAGGNATVSIVHSLPTLEQGKSIFFTLRNMGIKFVKAILQREYDRTHAKIQRSKSGTVLFFCGDGGETGMSSNMRAVYEEILSRATPQTEDIRVLESPTATQLSLVDWLSFVRELAQASILVMDTFAEVLKWLVLANDVRLVQLWHAGIGFKASGYARWGAEDGPRPFMSYRQIDYAICQTQDHVPVYAEVFGINEERVIPTGLPRLDAFMRPHWQDSARARALEAFPACVGKTVVLFAPTFRGTKKKGVYYPYNWIDFERLSALCGNDHIVLFKMHPWVTTPVPIPSSCSHNLFDASTYPDINDLFCISDVLVSDYSSSVFEFALFGHPVLLFAPDEEEYSQIRGFHQDYRATAPGPVYRSFDELLNALESSKFGQVLNERRSNSTLGSIDGHAAERVVNWLIIGEVPSWITQAIQAREQEWRTIDKMVFEEAFS